MRTVLGSQTARLPLFNFPNEVFSIAARCHRAYAGLGTVWPSIELELAEASVACGCKAWVRPFHGENDVANTRLPWAPLDKSRKPHLSALTCSYSWARELSWPVIRENFMIVNHPLILSS